MTRLVIIERPDLYGPKWKLVEPLFVKVINRTAEPEFAIKDLWLMAVNGSALIAYIEDAGVVVMAFAMEVIRYRKLTALNVMAMAGKRMQELFLEHSPEIQRFAKSFGATHFQASGSSAMAKLFKRLGYYSAYEVVRYKI
jgi:hypothetical protein